MHLGGVWKSKIELVYFTIFEACCLFPSIGLMVSYCLDDKIFGVIVILVAVKYALKIPLRPASYLNWFR